MLAIDHFMEVLGRISPIEWGRLLPGKMQANRCDHPPLIVWRFKIAAAGTLLDWEGAEGKVFDAIGHFNGRIKWTLEKPGRNIVLTTVKFMELQKSDRFQSDSEVLRVLAATDPQHGNDAHLDLADILELLMSKCSFP